MKAWKRYLYYGFSIFVQISNITILVATVTFIDLMVWHSKAYFALNILDLDMRFGLNSYFMLPLGVGMIILSGRNIVMLFLKRIDHHYHVVNAICAVIFGTFAITVLILYDFRKEVVELQMFDLMKNYTNDEIIRTRFDNVQLNLKCCGVKSYQDYNSKFPISCCGYDKNTHGTRNCETYNRKFQSGGCGRVYYAIMNGLGWTSLVLSLSFIIQRICLYGFYYFHKDYKQWKQGFW